SGYMFELAAVIYGNNDVPAGASVAAIDAIAQSFRLLNPPGPSFTFAPSPSPTPTPVSGAQVVAAMNAQSFVKIVIASDVLGRIRVQRPARAWMEVISVAPPSTERWLTIGSQAWHATGAEADSARGPWVPVSVPAVAASILAPIPGLDLEPALLSAVSTRG